MPSASAEPRLPVAIVTGFLGSGKTTLVNHILTGQTGLRFAVMVNEIGDIAIDGDLIVGVPDGLVELANGCICCSINDDLIKAVLRVLACRPSVDYLVIETTGIADPLPIALTFMRPEIRDKVRVDSIVAVADAAVLDDGPFGGKAALSQLRYADFVLLNKCDLVSDDRADHVEARIRAVTNSNRIVRAAHAHVALPLILGTGRYRGAHQLVPEPDDHLTADGFEAVSFVSEQALSAERFQAFLEQLPVSVFRAKGVLHIEGEPRRHLFHLVGRRFTLDPASADLGGHNRLVVIGRHLDAKLLRAQFAACLAPAAIPGPE